MTQEWSPGISLHCVFRPSSPGSDPRWRIDRRNRELRLSTANGCVHHDAQVDGKWEAVDLPPGSELSAVGRTWPVDSEDGERHTRRDRRVIRVNDTTSTTVRGRAQQLGEPSCCLSRRHAPWLPDGRTRPRSLSGGQRHPTPSPLAKTLRGGACSRARTPHDRPEDGTFAPGDRCSRRTGLSAWTTMQSLTSCVPRLVG
jgi:hypothetical protein